jgi:hypothetical protein
MPFLVIDAFKWIFFRSPADFVGTPGPPGYGPHGAAGARRSSKLMKFSQFTAATVTVALVVLVGRVTDATTGQSLPNVTIAIGSHRTTTDNHGAYRISGLAPGRYTLSASSSDVPAQRRSVVVKQNTAKVTLDLVLCSTTLDYSCASSGPG